MESNLKISLISKHQVKFELGGHSEIFEGWDIVNKVSALRNALIYKDVEELKDPVVIQAYLCVTSLENKYSEGYKADSNEIEFHVVNGINLLSGKDSISTIEYGKKIVCVFGRSFVIGPTTSENICPWCYEYLISEFEINIFEESDFERDVHFALEFARRIETSPIELVAFNGTSISRKNMVQVVGCQCTSYS